MDDKTNTAYLTIRCNEVTKEAFIEKASRHGGHAHIMRELVEAYIDGRIEMTTQTTTKEVYHVSGN